MKNSKGGFPATFVAPGNISPWLVVQNNTGSGSTGGGNPGMSYLRIRKVL